MSKLKRVTLYRCEVQSPDCFSEKMPDCSDCHTQSCMYNVGFSPDPCIVSKRAYIDEKGHYVNSDGTIIREI